MYHLPQKDSRDTHEFVVKVSPKGRIAIPKIIRDRLGMKPKDKVALRLDGGKITVTPVVSSLESIYQVTGILKETRSDREVTDTAWDEHAQEAAQEDDMTRRPV